MSAKLIAEGNLKQKQERFEQLLKRQQLKWKDRKRKLPHLVAKTSAELAAAAQGAHRQNVELAGVCSFAGDPRSILMWSHYAANHEGLCFQFEVAKDIGTFAHAVPVEYSDEYPVVNWIIGSEAGLLPTILRKHTGWSYELESRIVIPDGARKYLRFRPEALRGIIFGCRVKDSLIAKVRELLAERSSLGWMLPILYAARQHESRYNVRHS